VPTGRSIVPFANRTPGEEDPQKMDGTIAWTRSRLFQAGLLSLANEVDPESHGDGGLPRSPPGECGSDASAIKRDGADCACLAGV
jgi:hypothetical protein